MEQNIKNTRFNEIDMGGTPTTKLSHGSGVVEYLSKSVFFAVLYFLAFEIGTPVGVFHEVISAFWPASGVAVLFLYFFGVRFSPCIFIVSVVAIAFTQPISLSANIGIGIANTLEGILGAFLFRKYCRFQNVLFSTKQLCSLIAIVVFVACFTALIGILSFKFGGFPVPFFQAAFHWAMGDMLGILIAVLLTRTIVLASGDKFKSYLAGWKIDLPAVAAIVSLNLLLYTSGLSSIAYINLAIFLLPLRLLIAIQGSEFVLTFIDIFTLGASTIASRFNIGVFGFGHNNELLILPTVQIFNLVNIVVARLVRSQNQEIKKVIGELSQAVTARRKAEEEVHQQAETLNQGVRVANIGIFDHDQRAETIYWSEQMRKICGWGATEPVTLNAFIERIHPEDRETIVQAIQQAHDPAGSGLYSVEHRLLNSDGSVHWVSTKSQTFFEEKGTHRIPIRTVGASIDITELKSMGVSLKKAADNLGKEKSKLERSNKELEQFAGVAAHDLSSPLRSIQNWVDILNHQLPKPRDESLEETMEFIKRNAQKADTLIKDLLEVARVNVRPSHFETVNLNEVIENILNVLKKEIDGAAAEIQREPLPSVQGSPSQLESLFSNLLRNALTYRNKARSPIIVVGYKEMSDYYEFFVKDNGIGINPEFEDQIFEMFKRLHSEQEFPGTGIGLAFCKKVIELCGGKIWVSSVPGEGSTFYFTYPKNGGDKVI